MTREEKVRIARQLERMRVDVIEAGFPAASNGDFEAVKAVADSIKDSTVCGLARATEADIKRAGEALQGAAFGSYSYFYCHFPHSYGEEAAHVSRPGGGTSGKSCEMGAPIY